MKPILFFLLSWLIFPQLSAQQSTIITGKVTSCEPSQAFLKANTFNPYSMEEESRVTENPITADSTFRIETTDIILKPNTKCWLIIHDRVLEIILSPGDSLHVDTDYWSVQNSASFSGRGAGKNNYWKQYYQRFIATGRSGIANFNDASRIEYSRNIRGDKQTLLFSFYQTGQIDSLFYIQELKRIQFEFCVTLVQSGYGAYLIKTPDILTEFRRNLGEIDFNDESALENSLEYRMLINMYIGFLADSTGRQRNKTLQGYLDLADKYLTGNIHNYYSFSQIKEAIYNSQSTEKEAVLSFALSRYTDADMVRLLKGIEMETDHSGQEFTHEMLMDVLQIALFILIFTLGTIGLSRYIRRVRNKNRRINTMAVLLIFVGVVVFFFALRFHGKYYAEAGAWPEIKMSLLAIFLGIHTFFLVPILTTKKQYGLYALFILLIVSLYSLANYQISVAEFNSGAVSYFNEIRWLKFSLASSIIVILFSFFVYFLFGLAKNNQPASELVKNKTINIELIINVLLTAFLFLALILGQTQISGLRNSLILVLAMAVLYSQTFYFIPRFLFTGKYVKYLALSVGLFGLVVIILTGYDSLLSFFEIHRRGIPVEFIPVIKFPRNLELYLAIVPALIYAYARKLLIDRTNQGYVLYRNREAELQRLRAQVNPHFLFNSLNTVYALALDENNPKTAGYIAKLANMMRYMIEDLSEETISIGKEIDYIWDYINLQSIRCSVEHNINVVTDVQYPDFKIAPMLMIPFVENAFKHGINPNKVSDLNISIKAKDGHFLFEIENSIKRNSQSFEKEKGFGIGIENVRQRIELIYPDKSSLTISDNGNRFKVTLIITLP